MLEGAEELELKSTPKTEPSSPAFLDTLAHTSPTAADKEHTPAECESYSRHLKRDVSVSLPSNPAWLRAAWAAKPRLLYHATTTL